MDNLSPLHCPKAARRTRPVEGFTLIELMVAVAVVGILAAIGYPSYTEYVQRGKLVEATGNLSTLRVQLEQYYQDNRNYGSSASACGGGMAMPDSPSFTVSCAWGSSGTSQSFLATATGKSTSGMSGFVFTVNESNLQRTTTFNGSAVTANCWMKRSSDSC